MEFFEAVFGGLKFWKISGNWIFTFLTPNKAAISMIRLSSLVFLKALLVLNFQKSFNWFEINAKSSQNHPNFKILSSSKFGKISSSHISKSPWSYELNFSGFHYLIDTNKYWKLRSALRWFLGDHCSSWYGMNHLQNPQYDCD